MYSPFGLLTQLYPLKNKLEELFHQGYKLDMFCGIFTNLTAFGFELSAETLIMLGELNIKFGMCTYC